MSKSHRSSSHQSKSHNSESGSLSHQSPSHHSRSHSVSHASNSHSVSHRSHSHQSDSLRLCARPQDAHGLSYGNCSAHSGNGAACIPSCSSGYASTGNDTTQVCDGQTATFSPACLSCCIPLPCSAASLPSVPYASAEPPACSQAAAAGLYSSGTVCTFRCLGKESGGGTGGVTATCTAASWASSGYCLNPGSAAKNKGTVLPIAIGASAGGLALLGLVALLLLRRRKTEAASKAKESDLVNIYDLKKAAKSAKLDFEPTI